MRDVIAIESAQLVRRKLIVNVALDDDLEWHFITLISEFTIRRSMWLKVCSPLFIGFMQHYAII